MAVFYTRQFLCSALTQNMQRRGTAHSQSTALVMTSQENERQVFLSTCFMESLLLVSVPDRNPKNVSRMSLTKIWKVMFTQSQNIDWIIFNSWSTFKSQRLFKQLVCNICGNVILSSTEFACHHIEIRSLISTMWMPFLKDEQGTYVGFVIKFAGL